MGKTKKMKSTILALFVGSWISFPAFSLGQNTEVAPEMQEGDIIELEDFTIYADTPETLEEAVMEACREAKEDFAAGRSRFVVCGLPSQRTRDFADHLGKTYQIKPDFRGCVFSDSDDAYAYIYNEMTRLLFHTERDIDLQAVYQSMSAESD